MENSPRAEKRETLNMKMKFSLPRSLKTEMEIVID